MWRRLQQVLGAVSPKKFRNKLIEDDGDGLELACKDSPSARATELHDFANCINISPLNGYHDQESAGVSSDSTSSKVDSPSRLSASSSDSICDNGSVGTRSHGSLPSSSAAESQAGKADSLQQWQHAAAHIRLVVGALLEHAASSEQSQAQLQQLLASPSWSDACQQCRDTLLICTLLDHYFPAAIDLQQVSSGASSGSSSSKARSGRTASADRQHSHASSSSSSSSSSNPHAGAPAGDLTDEGNAARLAVFDDPLSQHYPIQQQQQQDSSNQLINQLSKQLSKQPAWHSNAQLCFSAIGAAGVQLPPGCSPSSISSGDPDALLQLLTAVIVAGEVQQQLQGECKEVLQALHHQQRQQAAHLPGNTVSSSSWSADSGQRAKGQQQGPDQQGIVTEQAWPLLQAWLAAVPNVLAIDQQQTNNVSSITTTVQGGGKLQAGILQQQQQAQPAGGMAGCSWQHVIAVLLQQQLQLQQGPQQQQQSSQAPLGPDSLIASQTTSTQEQPVMQDAANSFEGVSTNRRLVIDSDSSAVGNGGSTDIKIYSDGVSGVISAMQPGGVQLDMLQQLQQLGCSMLLLQQQDLTDTALQAAAAPEPMQLVLLLRLVGSTSHLWLPVIGQQQQQQGEQQQQQAEQDLTPQVPALHLHTPKQPYRRCKHSRGGSGSGSGSEDECSSGGSDASAVISPRPSWPPELLTTSQLWPGDEDEQDVAAITREERTLRCWINSLLRGSGSSRGSSSGDGSSSSSLGGKISSGGLGADKGCASSSQGDEVCGVQDFSVLSLTATATAAASAAAASGVNSSSSSNTVAAGRGVPRVSRAGAEAAAAANTPIKHTPHANGAAAASGLTNVSSSSSGSLSTLVAAGPGTRSPCGFSFCSISSLFGAELRSGVLLLELLEHLQPGCVDWRLANRLPAFKGMGRAAQMQALENCQLALRIAKEELGLPLVSMSPQDVMLGRRKVILSLVYQLMRFHTMQLLERIAAHQQQDEAGHFNAAAGAAAGGSPAVTPRAAAGAGGRLNLQIRSSSKKQRRQLAITERDILDWANAKLQQVQPLHTPAAAVTTTTAAAAAATDGHSSSRGSEAGGLPVQEVVVTPVLTSFRDPVLASGLVLLQLLHVMAPDALDLKHVMPGVTPEQRQSNAKYALSVADKMGCSLFLVWEDLVDLQPRMVLVLLASLMYLDQSRKNATSCANQVEQQQLVQAASH